MITGIEYKGLFTSTKDAVINVDEAAGIIEGYASVFGNTDSDMDIMMPGCYSKTLQENYRRIKHLYQHDPFKPLSGTKNNNLVLVQDNYGLKYTSTVSKTSYGRDCIRLHLDGVIDENSVGFQTMEAKDVMMDGNFTHREITQVKLWEVSSVTYGANDMAQNTSSKSISKETLFTKMNSVMKAIRNGKYENEDLFDALEIYLKQLQSDFNKLTTTPVEETTGPDELKQVADLLTRFNKTLNL